MSHAPDHGTAPAPQHGAGGVLGRIDRGAAGLLRWALILLMMAMSVSVLLQVVFRHVLGQPLAWSEEAARFLFVWVTFVGAALLVREDGHIAVTSFIDGFPARVRNAILIVAKLVALVCVWQMLDGGTSVMLAEWNQRAPASQVLMGVVYAVIPVTTALMSVWLVAGIARHAIEIVRPSAP